MVKLPDKESETVEFKTSFQNEVIETLVAFANTKGGTVYVGVKDNGNITGVQLGAETLQNWLNSIKQKTQPAIIPEIREWQENGKTIVSIRVQEFPIKPLAFKGRYYKRVHNANHLLTAHEITDLNLQSLQLSWDAYHKPKKSVADLSEDKNH